MSLWLDTLPGPITARPALTGDIDVDVAIVGGGYTGLWTAYYLALADPALQIAVLEREFAGFGASGRNGGWCSALFPASAAKLARLAGREAAVAMVRAMRASVDEVLRAAVAEGIDAHASKGGTLTLARTPVQVERARAVVAEARTWGLGEEDLRLLDAAEARDALAATSVLAASYTPHCARIHPARLVRGLADAVERRGVRIYEGTAVTALLPQVARTARARVRARYIVRATEGYTHDLPRYRRALAPVYSLMVATEPLPADFWRETGLRRYETFTDHRRLIIYGQRTADDRIAFGGRGAPYHFGSRTAGAYDCEPRVFAELHRVLLDLFPALRDAAVTHTWGGPLGVPRDWVASVGLEDGTGIGWAGGYVGDGVTTSNLAGRTLADLILHRDTDLVHLPWVGHRSRPWEPEPLRWLGVNAGLRAMTSADRAEERTGRAARRAASLSRFFGG